MFDVKFSSSNVTTQKESAFCAFHFFFKVKVASLLLQAVAFFFTKTLVKRDILIHLCLRFLSNKKAPQQLDVNFVDQLFSAETDLSKQIMIHESI